MLYLVELTEKQLARINALCDLSGSEELKNIEFKKPDDIPVESNPMYVQGFKDRELKAKLDEEKIRAEYEDKISKENYIAINTAWEVAKNVLEVYYKELKSPQKLINMFGLEMDKDEDIAIVSLFKECSCAEINARLINYYKEEIKVGDFVTNGENIALVTMVSERELYLMFPDGSSGEYEKSEWEKCDILGHFEPLGELLELMKKAREKLEDE